MKIILSPSKTQDSPGLSYHSDIPLLDKKATLSLFKKLQKMSPEDLGKAMGIQGKLLDKTVLLYHSFDPKVTPQCDAISLYTGVVYDQLELSTYDEQQKAYLADHVRILSAMYGLLHPSAPVWPYRLDFTMRLPELRLKALWSKRFVKALKAESLIIDLSSQEFSGLLAPLKPKIHQVIFLESIDGQEKIISTNVKKARGKMAHYMIQNRIRTIDEMRAFCEDGYRFQPTRSHEKSSVFLKVFR